MGRGLNDGADPWFFKFTANPSPFRGKPLFAAESESVAVAGRGEGVFLEAVVSFLSMGVSCNSLSD